MPFKDHHSKVAAQYAAHRPHYPDALFDLIAPLAPSRMCAWDVATGSGQAAVPLASRFERVFATDASAEQLTHAQPHPRIHYRCAAAERSGLPDACADLITVAQALHWFDLEAFAREATRVARPGGALTAWCYGLNHIAPAIDTVIDAFYDGPIRSHWPPERRHIDAAYGTLDLPFPEIGGWTLEMRCGWTLDEFLAYVRTWSGARRAHETTGVDPVAAFERDLRPLWAPATERKQVVWPLTVRAWRIGAAG